MAKLCCMETDIFVREIETEDFHKKSGKMWRQGLIQADIQRTITGLYH